MPRTAVLARPREGVHVPFSPLRLGGLQGWWAADLSPTTLAAGMAAQFTAANLEYLSIADNTSLSMGDIDFTCAGWVYFDTLVGATRNYGLIGKYTTVTNNREYLVALNTNNNLTFIVSSDGTGANTASATDLTALSTGTWYFVVGWHDATNNLIGISVNNNNPTTTAWANGVLDSTTPFNLGNWGNNTQYHDGRMCGVGIWKRVLTAAERTALYNSGNGLTYDQLRAAGLNSSLISYWELNEPSGTRNDSHGTNHLTDNNTVTTSAGLILNAISQVNDLSGNGRHLVQATQAKKPVYRGPFSTYQAGWALDGVDDLFTADAIGTALTGEDIPFTIVTVFSPTATTANNDMWSLGSSASSNPYVFHRMDAGPAYGTQIRDDTGLAGGTKNWSGTLASTAALHASIVMTTGTLGNAFVDGTPTGTADADVNVGTLTLNQFGVGALWRQTASQFFTGTIKEVMVFNRVLSSKERAQVQRYLSHRWGMVVV